MPAMMIHLAAAREYAPESDGFFYFGSMAPDYTDARAIKDIIHLRNAESRPDALRELRETIDPANAFELGWLLHLYTDYCWDTDVIPGYRDSFTGEGNWFTEYRLELGRISFSLYRSEPWAADVWARMNALYLRDMRAVTRTLPVPLELEWFRDRIRARHERGGSPPDYFTRGLALEFARKTAARFRDWMNIE
ncbi:MAG: zinc dependent phospholipase C family protein [Oscillospiraceae bacterium]|jgi:hypothetical protein|nr:zinc dependent phospholipase C family protein [Oscillospiraceae bacterium]